MFSLTQLSKIQCNYLPYNALKEAYESRFDDMFENHIFQYHDKNLDLYAKLTELKNVVTDFSFKTKYEFSTNILNNKEPIIVKLSSRGRVFNESKDNKNIYYRKVARSKYLKHRIKERSEKK